MAGWIKKLAKTISEKGGIFMFIRAQFSSQISSLTDFTVTLVLVNVFGLFYGYATFTGSVCGGIVNSIVNYKWTFKAQGIKKRYVAIKYLIVWVCSILFNTFGTILMTELISKIVPLKELLGENLFVVSKIVVSLLVGFLWNYNMQRLFVYKNRDFGKYLKKVGIKTHDIEDVEPEKNELDAVKSPKELCMNEHDDKAI